MSNYIKKVAITGATGNSGKHMTYSLLQTGKHVVTAITRADSNSQPPQGCKVAKVDYNDEATLVDALKGQDALVITLGVMVEEGTQEKLIRAAGEAGVPWIMPNEWAPDVSSQGVRDDVFNFAHLDKVRNYITKLGKSSYIAQSNGFWYEWSLPIPSAFGFDIQKKEATFFDEGETKISVSTWPQCGRAVAAILSLPIKSDAGPSLEKYRNQNIYINSFTLNQKEMLDNLLKVTGDKAEDWKITKEPARERLAKAKKGLQSGDRQAFVEVMYTRIFLDDGVGNYEALGKLANAELGLPKENLDDATKVAIDRSKAPMW